MIILSKLFILLAITYCLPANAEIRPIFSGSLVYAKMNEPGIKLENKVDPSFSMGLFAKKERLIGSLTTNRFTTFISTRNATNEKTGSRMISKSKAQSDVLAIGYTFNKFAPSILISNTRIRKQLESEGETFFNKTKNAILTGVATAYFIDKNFSISVFYILPNQKLRIQGAIGTSVNFIF